MNEKLNDALNEISDKHIEEAAKTQKRRRPYWVAAVAAMLAVVIGISAVSGGFFREPDPTVPIIQGSVHDVPDPTGIQSPGNLQLANLVATPEYPQMSQRPNENDYSDYDEYTALWNAWKSDQTAQYDQPDGYADSLTDFFYESIRQFLKAEENSAYSPLNVYMALAMLAEVTDGNSRQQVLDLLGLDSIEALRQQANYVWNAHYSDDGATTLLLGSSVWLDKKYTFHQNTVDTLSDSYYASVFHGDLGSYGMNEQLRTWLDSQTGGLLQDQAKEVSMDPGTVFALATTVYFAASWENEFSPNLTEDSIFHCGDYDLLTPFMHKTYTGYSYYRGDNFGAISLSLSGGNDMWLILPDEGYTVAEILESDDYLRMTMDPSGWKNKGTYKIHLSLPKFDVVSSTDLVPGLQEMGITDVFDPDISDFSSLTDTPDLFMSGATHAARVVIDEEGCVAAAFTAFIYGITGELQEYEEIDFTLDRPFLFVVSSRDDLPLFVGTVAEP